MDTYSRYLKERGLEYPSREAQAIEYAKVKEDLLVPEGALRFGHNPDNGRVVSVLPEELKTGLHVVGGSQRGKSNLLSYISKQILDRHEHSGAGFAVVDPHGPLAEYVLDLCVKKGPAFAKRVYYFDLREWGKVPVFNPLRGEYGAALVANCFAEALLKALGTEVTTDLILTAQVIKKTAQVLIHNGLSVAEAPVLTLNTRENLEVRERLLENVPEKEVRDYWLELGALPPRERKIDTAPAERRFEYLLEIPAIRRILGQTLPGFDLKKIMDEGHICIFNLAAEENTVPLEAQRVIGALILQGFRTATVHRTPWEARPFWLIVDEFGNFVSHDMMRVFTEAAKFGLRCVVSHQGMYQLMLEDNDVRLARSVMAIEHKVVFGAGLVEEKLELARQIFGPWVDPDKRKLEIFTKLFRPKLRKEVVKSGSSTIGLALGLGEAIGKSLSEGESEGESHTKGRAHTKGGARGRTHTEADVEGDSHTEGKSKTTITPPEGEPSSSKSTSQQGTTSRQHISTDTLSEQETWQDTVSQQDTVSRGQQWGRGWSWVTNLLASLTGSLTSGWQETFVTDHEEDEQLSGVQYKSVDEQIFEGAQESVRARVGRCVVANGKEEPAPCQVPLTEPLKVSEGERGAFLEEVYEKECYLTVEEADRQIEHRKRRLLRSGEVFDPEAVWEKPGE